MTQHGDTNNMGLDLDPYGDGDEATLRREPARDAGLDPYEEDEVATAPWTPRV